MREVRLSYAGRPRDTECDEPRRTSQLLFLFRVLLVGLLYLIVASVVLNAFMTEWGFLDSSPRNGFPAMMSGTAHRPFAYRILVPALVNGVADLVPDTLVYDLREFLLKSSPVLKYVEVRNGWSSSLSLRYHITYALMFFSLFGIELIARRLLIVVYGASGWVRDFLPAGALLVLPLTFVWGGYMYDFPQLFLIAGCILCLIRQRLWLYYLLFILAVLNKESDVLIAVSFIAFYLDRVGRKELTIQVAAQLIAGGAVIIIVRDAMAANLGHPVYFNLIDNLRYWLHPSAYLSYTDIYAFGIPHPRGGNIILLFLAGVAVFYRWNDKPHNIRLLLILSAATSLPLFILFGYRDETRTLAPMFPAIFLLGAHTIAGLYSTHGLDAAPE